MIVRKITCAAVALLWLSAGLAFLHPWGDVRNAILEGEILDGATVPANVRVILETKCADCHSNRTHWPVYSRLAPISWLLEHDVRAAQTVMDLSRWKEMSANEQTAALTRIAAEARSGQMPLRAYTLMHPAARLSPEDKRNLIAWARAERTRVRATAEQPKGADHQ